MWQIVGAHIKTVMEVVDVLSKHCGLAMIINTETLVEQTVQWMKGEMLAWVASPHEPFPSLLWFIILVPSSLLPSFVRNGVGDSEGFRYFALMTEDHLSEVRCQSDFHFKACYRKLESPSKISNFLS